MNQEYRVKEFRYEENGELTPILDNGIQIQNARLTTLDLFEPDKTKRGLRPDDTIKFTQTGFNDYDCSEERKYLDKIRKILKDRESNTGGSNE